MKFSVIPYQRPDIDRVKQEMRNLLEELRAAGNAAVQSEAIYEINKLRSEFESMAKLAGIRHTLDTEDAFYKTEQDYYDETKPLYQEVIHEYYGALVSSPYQQELSARWGQHLFTIAEMTLRTFSPAVIEDLQQENKLSSRYKQLLASAAIPFAGEERNLAQLVPYQMSVDRDVRKSAHEARYTFFSERLDEFDGIYHELVGLRTQTARKLGFADFTELGYLRMNRSDYNPAMVASLRRQVEKHVVPLASQLRENQRIRLGLDDLLYYDEKLLFPTGNAAPQGMPEEIVAGAAAMYTELSAETGEFFHEMTDRGLFDLLSRKGKAAGGYCAYLS
ncbi:MAG: M3 family oligoendopeptidase, partial [Bacillota bacterium]|nr:M3 family oligoendopeptidase [Bacillota bacterium]